MLTISNYSGVGKSHPRRGLFNSFGSRSGKVNYRWDLLDIDFDFIEWFIKKKWRKTMQWFSFRDSELQVRQRDSMTQWQNDKMTKGGTDKKQVKQNWLPNDDFYCWHWNERGLKIWFMLKKTAQSKNWNRASQWFLWDILMWIDFQGGGEKNLG